MSDLQLILVILGSLLALVNLLKFGFVCAALVGGRKHAVEISWVPLIIAAALFIAAVLV